MNVKIINGTNTIGGSITAISSKKARILIDFGPDVLSLSQNVKPDISRLAASLKEVDAIFITHYHLDHMGFINQLEADIPIFIDETSAKIYSLTNDFTNNENKAHNFHYFHFFEPIKIKDLTITPLLADHSAYNAAMFLIQNAHQTILHTGDFRFTGRKNSLLIKTLKKLSPLDLLITEGTTFSRDKTKSISEYALEKEATKIFKDYQEIFLLSSSTNIDRLVSFYKSALKTHKNFILDAFSANITLNLPSSIPNPKTFAHVSVWIPLKYRFKSSDFKAKYIEPLKKYSYNKSVHKPFCMYVKTSMISDIATLKRRGYLTKPCLIYSMWEGYKEEKTTQEFLIKIASLGIDIITLHTSGHCDASGFKLLNNLTNPKTVIPLHTTAKHLAKEYFLNATILDDNEVFTL